MQVLRYAAFSSDPAGGNPAGVVLDADAAADAELLRTAAEVGYSETAFLAPTGERRFAVRYFSPLAEVPFCGHATVAGAVAIAQRDGPGGLVFDTPAGRIEIATSIDGSGIATATLTSVAPSVADLAADDLAGILRCLRWSARDLDPALPPRVAFAGAFHPIVAVRTRERLATLDYDFEALGALMAVRDWTTVDLIWRESPTVFHARNPFPPGGIVEDPVTGAAAAAFGGYLRALGLVELPARLTIHQGHDLGRPGVIGVDIPADPSAGISVTGTAVPIAV